MAMSVETAEQVWHRMLQAETDIHNLADSILKLTEAVQKMRTVQDESLVLMGRLLSRLNLLKEE